MNQKVFNKRESEVHNLDKQLSDRIKVDHEARIKLLRDEDGAHSRKDEVQKKI